MAGDENKLVKLNTKDIEFAASSSVDTPLLVCSHERSGTHFLMNSIAACSHYTATPWMNFDLVPYGGLLNFYSQSSVDKFISKFTNIRMDGKKFCVSGIIKSHHPAWTFQTLIKKRKIKVAYIYRNPVDVFISYWKLLHGFDWNEGPKTDTPYDLCVSSPAGQTMRFQERTYETYFDRWANHVSAWLEAASNNSNIHIIKYEDLINEFNNEITSLCNSLDVDIISETIYPSRDENVISGAKISLPSEEKIKLDDYCRLRIKDYPKLDGNIR